MLSSPATAVAEIAAAHLDTPAERFASFAAVIDCAEQHRAVLGLVGRALERPGRASRPSTWRADPESAFWSSSQVLRPKDL
jgi:hypothetical protein